ncbi:hypothetical protein Rsub_07918 [Raphidocelis subcapitata]|uniref:DAGKc domain-containing protein n=1 Tax=Raphidocelis subcapitata TaxID=307507 RepID=A0A2V0PBC8_9CHLO|nr:hypothetical protein Rsub_07918 [Raphidocelis subcapitata]|eukprot:GBF95203.1 hypothetical protein Rsub_07918 [Raphidocelis subcapitata]
MLECCVIFNPASGGGRGEARWRRAEPAFAAALAAGGYSLQVLRTACPGDATRLAQEAAERGAAAVVAAGGDGLANEVVCGLMAAGEAARGAGPIPRLGLLPIGSGNDFAKTHGWSDDAAAAARRVVSGETAPLDVGTLTLLGPADGGSGGGVNGRGNAGTRPPARGAGDSRADARVQQQRQQQQPAGERPRRQRFFLNVASCGVGAAAVRLVERYKWAWPLCYQLAAVHALLCWRPRCDWEASADGGPWRRVAAPALLAAGNGSFWGGGFRICPGADSGDGALSITTAAGLGLWDFVFRGHLLRSGRHLSLRGVEAFEIRSQLEVRPVPRLSSGAESGSGGAGDGRGGGGGRSGKGGSRDGAGGGPAAAGLVPAADAARATVWETDGEPAGEGAAIVGVVAGALRLCV